MRLSLRSLALAGALGCIFILVPQSTSALELDVRVASLADIQLSPPTPDTLPGLAEEAWRNGRTAEAERLYRLLLDRNPDDTLALHRLALLSAWAGRTEEALAFIDRVLQLEPANMDARSDRARFLAWAGRYTESVSAYDQLLGISPGDRTARRDRAQTLSWAEDFENAVAEYRALLAEDPDDVPARLGLAQVLSFSGRLDEALEEYDRILTRHPDDVRALQGKGRALAWQGDLREAEATLRRAVELEEEDVDSRVSLAQVLRWQGRNAAALDELDVAERLAPGRGDVDEQRRWAELSVRPTARLSVSGEGDSDGNRMTTLALGATVGVTRRTGIRVDAYHRFLEFQGLERGATGVMLSASVLLEPGWTVTGGVGSAQSRASHSTAPRVGMGSLSLSSPARNPVGGSLTLSRTALDATALQAQRAIRVEGGEGTLRWTPSPQWALTGGAGLAWFEGDRRNRRLSGSAAVTRRVSDPWTVGLAGRGFGFESEEGEGYFSPERFLLGEFTTRWLHEPGSWSLLLEGAPGVQRIRSDDPTLTLRGSGRITYRAAPGREAFVGGGVSTAGIQTFASEQDYRYWAWVAGASWVF